MKRIAIIPARGGSKRIKNKNIKKFNDKPIISYIIETCLESKLFDKIHVSTDSHNIKNIIENNGLKIDFMRPSYLADDHTPLMPVMLYVIKEYKKLNINFEEIWILMPCSPLIEVSDLEEASKKYEKNKMSLKPLMAVTEYPVPIEWAFINKNGILYPRFEETLTKRSQDLPKSFFESGTFMIFPEEYILSSEQGIILKEYISYELSKMKGIDIDNQDDWELAEAIHLYKMKK